MSSPKILLIIASMQFRSMLVSILEHNNYAISEALNGEEGVSMATSQTPDCIICEYQLPDMEGSQVKNILSNYLSQPSPPFIFFMGETKSQNLPQSEVPHNAFGFPWSEKDLLSKVSEKIARYHQQLRRQQDLNYVKRFLNVEDNVEVENDKSLLHYKKKEHIFSKGEMPQGLYYIINGKIKLYNRNELNKDYIYKLYSKGDFFGWNAIVNELEYHNNAQAISDVVLKVIPKDQFLDQIENNLKFANSFIHLIALYELYIEKEILELAYSSVRKRVANALVAFAVSQPVHFAPLKASREDLASKAGVAKETLIRTLSDFKAEGIIQIKGSEIIFIDKYKLVSIPR